MNEGRSESRLASFFGAFGYTIFCVLAVSGAVELLSYLAMKRIHPETPPFYAGHCRGAGGKCVGGEDVDVDLDTNSASSAYDKYNWAEDFWREERRQWHSPTFPFRPFVAWENSVWQGPFSHFDPTDSGNLRRTINARSDCPTTVWTFGGSTMMGYGSPDDMTIPTYLSQELNSAPGACVTVINRGVDAYNSNQEVILLQKLLKTGRRPALAVFYDGVNDTTVGTWNPDGWESHADAPRMRKILETRLSLGTALRSVLLDSSSVAFARWAIEKTGHRPAQDAEASDTQSIRVRRAPRVLENYEANLRIVRAIAREFDFRVMFFWQPMIYYGDKPHDWFEKGLLASRPDLGENDAVCRDAERRASGQYTFLGHVFDGVSDPIYIDPFHVSPEGNRMLAHRMAEAIRASGFPRESSKPVR